MADDILTWLYVHARAFLAHSQPHPFWPGVPIMVVGFFFTVLVLVGRRSR